MSEAPQPRVRFDPTVTVGAMVQVGVLLIGFITYLLTGSSEVRNLGAQVARLDQAVAGQANATRDALREAIGRIEVQVGQVPQLGEQLRAIERDVRRHDEAVADLRTLIESRRTSVDNRIDSLRQSLMDTRGGPTWGGGPGRGREPPAP